MAWKVHVITGAGKPSAEHDKFTAVPINASTLCSISINLAVTKQKHYIIMYICILCSFCNTVWSKTLAGTNFDE